MKYLSSLLSATLLTLHSVSALNAIAFLSPIGNSTASGSVTFSLAADSNVTTVTVAIKGLTPGNVYGAHIHQWGDISDSEKGLITGGHFNPTNKSHACPLVEGYGIMVNETLLGSAEHHVGDLFPSGQLLANEMGEVSLTIPVPDVSLDVLKPEFIIGRTLTVHSGPDDCVTQPTGNSGGRIAQGVVGWGSEAPEASSADDSVVQSIASAYPSGLEAIAVLKAVNNSNVNGVVQFSQAAPNKPVYVYIKASGVPANAKFGFHIHHTGNVSDTAAGLETKLHYNPLNVTHGCFVNSTRHAGDLDSLTSNGEGKIEATISSDLFSLFRGAKTYAIGRGLVIHAKVDDCTGTVGNAGARISQGVLGYRNNTLKFEGSVSGSSQSSPSPTSGSEKINSGVVMTVLVIAAVQLLL
ncbi:hypothetical protein HK098_000760 [Nowakowskiella sp. JEL0407]|nr:hypothetical protein HK098_000760 [Nowakowskiella sp. JEL0407]